MHSADRRGLRQNLRARGGRSGAVLSHRGAPRPSSSRLGSVNGTIKEVVDQERDAGAKIGSVSICSFRPFPLVALCDLLEGAKRVICVEKSLAPGLGGVLASNIRMALRRHTTPVYTVIAGLGGRPITRKSLAEVFERAARDNLDDITFLDLNWEVVHQQLAHARERAAPVRLPRTS